MGMGTGMTVALAESLWNQNNKRMLPFLQPILDHKPPQLLLVSSNAYANAKNFRSSGAIEAVDNGNDLELETFCKQGQLKEALHRLQVMDFQGILPDSSTYFALVQACVEKKNKATLIESQIVHAHMIETGFKPHTFLDTKLVVMYTKYGSLASARQLLNEMTKTNVVSWTAMIAAYASRNHSEEALQVFYQMLRAGIQPNHFTFSSFLPVCGDLGALENGKEVHEDIIRSGFESDNFVGNALIDMYVNCSCVDDARKVFDRMPDRDLISWNAMIAGYAEEGPVDEAFKLFEQMPRRNVVSWTVMIAAYSRHGQDEEALTLFNQMQQVGIQPDQFTFASVLPVYANLKALGHGKEVHADIIRHGFQSDVFVGSALIDMYVKCGSLDNARSLFDRISVRDVVLWNAMIAGYAQNGRVDDALELFQKMPIKSLVSWNTMIAGLAQNGYIDEAAKLFQKLPEQDMVSSNSMITGYAQNGYIDEAMKLFENMTDRNVVSWNAMVAGFAQGGYFNESLKLFQQMQLTAVKPNSVTFASVLPACAHLAALEHGKGVHAEIIRSGFQSEIFVGNALVDMYTKCGNIKDARKGFDKMPRKSTVSWTTMVVGYATHGFGDEALQVFEQMQQSNMKPNHITFIGALSACCHAGLVDRGWQIFDSMNRDYHVIPRVEHYCCMVDLLGRAGRLDEAEQFINNMPIKPEASVWGCLLAACRTHTNVDLGERVAKSLFELDSKNASYYVLLSNIYAACSRWDDVKRVRKIMKDQGIQKMPGSSWIEVNGKVYAFLVGDKSHPQSAKIYDMLEKLFGKMMDAGYVPEIDFALHDVEEEQKENILGHHSEKLAIAFGLMNTSCGTTIRITKNLRVCGDCHSATKFISKIVDREIIVRDANRFHHFKDGLCSCGDYW